MQLIYVVISAEKKSHWLKIEFFSYFVFFSVSVKNISPFKQILKGLVMQFISPIYFWHMFGQIITFHVEINYSVFAFICNYISLSLFLLKSLFVTVSLSLRLSFIFLFVIVFLSQSSLLYLFLSLSPTYIANFIL